MWDDITQSMLGKGTPSGEVYFTETWSIISTLKSQCHPAFIPATSRYLIVCVVYFTGTGTSI